MALRLTAAVVFGGVIGLERTAAGKAAGVRTHMLVALGACVFVVAPAEAGMSPGDLGRTVQGVAAGVGFIGAGTILKRSDVGEVEGLTTAASLWLAAAIGLAVGAGAIWIPFATAVLSLAILSLVGRLQQRFEQSGPAHAGSTPDRAHTPEGPASSLLAETVARWQADRVPAQAAALAYYALFSLAPLLVIAIGVAGLVLGQEEARAQIVAQATALVGPSGASALESLMGSRAAAPRSGAISTVIGFVALLLGAAAVLGQLRTTLNTVWDVQPPDGETWAMTIRKQLTSFALVVATGFLLLVSLIASAALAAASAAARGWLPGLDAVWFVVDAAAGLAVASGIFALVFKTVPETTVHWHEVLVGGVATALLFTVGRLLLGWYLGGWGSTSAYGAAGSVLAMLIWVYYSAQLVLFGAEFTFVYGRRRARRHATAQEVS